MVIAMAQIDARDRQQEFFEALVFLGLCRPGTGLKIKSSDIRRAHSPEESLWHQVLDDFCWLADGETGGQSVASDAGVEFEGERILLVAMNHNLPLKTFQHLEQVLKLLQKCSGTDEATQLEIREEIFQSSVKHSRRKVHNYKSRLFKCIKYILNNVEAKSTKEGKEQRAENSKSYLHSLDMELQKALLTFLLTSKDFPKLCKRAYDFRKTSYMLTIDKKCTNGRQSRWSSIRHLLGRLGSWFRSAKNLVKIAATEPQLLKGYQVQDLRSRVLPFARPRVYPNSFNRAMRIACPDLDQNRVLSVLRSRHECSRAKLKSLFEESLGNVHLEPFIHAEVLIADHIYINDLRFVHNDKYIGCSKPSCYGCHLYLELHPGDFHNRPCHGNLYLKWSPGLAGLDPNRGGNLFEKMLHRIRRDIRESVLSQTQTTNKLPDSSSGLSPSLTVITKRPFGAIMKHR